MLTNPINSRFVGKPEVIQVAPSGSVPKSVQLALARQDEKERRERDDVGRRSDDSYSPRRHWCSIVKPDDKRGSGVCVQMCDDVRQF